MLKPYLNERGYLVFQALDQVADRHGSTPAGVALARLLARSIVTAPIARYVAVSL
jgi:aryl-alcohol dehydrogenase-like predicted oxidoreductase